MQDVSLSNNIIKSRVRNMSQCIEKQLMSQKTFSHFALQYDESTDVAHCY